MDRAGLADDGPTHHGLFDIGYLRHVPNMVHMQPKDEDEFCDMLWTMANYDSGPIAMRYPRGAGTGAQPKATPKLLEIGKAEVVQHGREIAIFGLGNMFEVAAEAARKLEERGFSVALVNRAGLNQWIPERWNFSREAARSSARSRITCCTTVSAARSWSTCPAR